VLRRNIHGAINAALSAVAAGKVLRANRAHLDLLTA
jgi:hypothetical protein